MTKRVFMVHGYRGHPLDGWRPWLKDELEKRGYEVNIFKMPSPDMPVIKEWVDLLKTEISNPGKDTILIGHSLGCAAIMHYVLGFNDTERVSGIVFVAGFINSVSGLEQDDMERVREWLTTPMDTNKIKERAESIVAIFSDNDPFVPTKNAEEFKEKLGAEIIIEHAKGHMNSASGITELPSALEAVLRISE